MFGALGTSETRIQELAREIGQLIGGASITYQGRVYNWNALVQALLNAASNYRDAGDLYFEHGDELAEAEARAGYSEVMGVYNALAELYREWPDLGIDPQTGRLSGWPAALLAISAYLTGAGIVVYAASRLVASGHMVQTAREAADICGQAPASEACAEARRAAEDAGRNYREGGADLALGLGAGMGGLVLVAGAGLLFALSRK